MYYYGSGIGQNYSRYSRRITGKISKNMKIGSQILFGAVAVSALVMAGCSTLTFDEHDEKYKNLSLDELLDTGNLSSEHKTMLENTLVKKAAISSEAGNHAAAASHARMALKLSPNDPVATLSLAEALLGLGEYAEAEKTYAGLLVNAPSAKAYQGHGLSLLAQNKSSEAQVSLNEAVAMDSNLWRSWNGLGVIYDLSESWELSEQAYKAGIRVAGQNATINNNLGLSYLRQNRLQEAIIAFENVIVLPGGKQLSNMNYRTALALNGQLEKAKADATDVEVAQLYNNLGVISMNAGEPTKAVEYLKKAIAISPSYYARAVKNLEIAKSNL